MRSGTIAILFCVLLFHRLADLPPSGLRWLLPPCLVIAIFFPKLRLLILLACGFLWAHVLAFAHFSHDLAPELEGRAQGNTQLDMMILSHNDNGHIGGARSVLDTMHVDIVVSRLAHQDLPVARQPCSDQHAWEWDGVSFRFIHLPPDHVLDGNDASCVLVI